MTIIHARDLFAAMSDRRRRSSRSRSRERPRVSRTGEREARDARDKARSKSRSPVARREVASVAVEKENVPVDRKDQPKVDREKVR